MLSERTRKALKVIEAAVLLGVLGDVLLRVTPLGLGVLLWTGAIVASVYALGTERNHAEKEQGEADNLKTNLLSRDARLWLLPCALLFAAAFTWRDAGVLKFADACGVLLMLGLASLNAHVSRLRVAGVVEYAAGIVRAYVRSLYGIFPLLGADVRWSEVPRGRSARFASAAVRGVVIAAPLVLVFGLLFMAADAVFNRLVADTFRFDVYTVVTHGWLFAVFAWLTGGYLRGMFLGASETPQESLRRFFAPTPRGTNSISNASTPTPRSVIEDEKVKEVASGEASVNVTLVGESARANEAISVSESAHKKQVSDENKRQGFALGVIETSVVLGLLNALFLSFVLVQVRYFFGGATQVLTTAGLTYAEYARRGFFELVWVVALVLPLLLLVHWLVVRGGSERAARLYRVLAGALVALLCVIMVSAVSRMMLYTGEYGLTELRLYTTAFMAWLGLTLAWFVVTVIVGNNRERFACGSLIGMLLTIVALHVINPDALIVRTNIRHAHERERIFDADYATSLSADAVPALVAGLSSLRDAEQMRVAHRLVADWSMPETTDWRTWHAARSKAWSTIEANRLTLQPLATRAEATGNDKRPESYYED